MTEAQMNREIYGQIQMAKYDRGLTVPELADKIGIKASTLSNLSCQRKLTELDIWTVAKILKLNGKKLEFTDA